MRVVALYSIKGGVGKTAAAVNLAYLAAATGRRVLLWDLDPQGATSFYYRVKAKVKGGAARLLAKDADPERAVKGTDYPGLDLLPADFSYRYMDLLLNDKKHPEERLARIFAPLAESYDLVLIDCAPGITLVSENLFRTTDAMLIPIVPTPLSLRTYDQLEAHLGPSSAPRVWPFFSLVDRRKRLHQEVMVGFRATHPITLGAEIPYASQVERMGVERAPLPTFSPRDPASEAYRALAEEALSRLDTLPRHPRQPR